MTTYRGRSDLKVNNKGPPGSLYGTDLKLNATGFYYAYVMHSVYTTTVFEVHAKLSSTALSVQDIAETLEINNLLCYIDCSFLYFSI